MKSELVLSCKKILKKYRASKLTELTDVNLAHFRSAVVLTRFLLYPYGGLWTYQNWGRGERMGVKSAKCRNSSTSPHPSSGSACCLHERWQWGSRLLNPYRVQSEYSRAYLRYASYCMHRWAWLWIDQVTVTCLLFLIVAVSRLHAWRSLLVTQFARGFDDLPVLDDRLYVRAFAMHLGGRFVGERVLRRSIWTGTVDVSYTVYRRSDDAAIAT